MTAAAVIAVVGPSGVGKDSVMAGLAREEPRLRPIRRAITRPASAGAEDHEPLEPAEFDRRVAAGDFHLHWRAHGHGYGVPRAALAELASDEAALVNLSRGMLNDAARCFPRLIVLHLTARPETLASRLSRRGREDAQAIARRLARPATALPPEVPTLEIANDGALEATVAQALAGLRRFAALA